MIQFSDIFQIVGDSFFGGNVLLGGLIILTIVLALVYTLTKSAFAMLLISMPVTLVFSYMRVIPDEITIILLLVSVVGLAMSSKKVFT